MRFFFLSPLPDGDGGPVAAPAELVRHLRALRLDPAEDFLLVDGDSALRCRWPGRDRLEPVGPEAAPRLDLRPVRLVTAWPKGPRADELVARAAEAGVAAVQPLRTERSVAGVEDFRPNRLARWERIARETCQQCRNPRPPQLAAAPLGLEEALAATAPALRLLLRPSAPPLALALTGVPVDRELALFVGPEGGFTEQEEARILAAGAVAVGLLPTVLRIEAAGPLGAALCQQDRGHGRS